ncbi:peroxiredoxin family protein [Desulfonatronum thioautotrophicum]|uniref:peroxiredoxin family protein n=1 Tax=Desulfonatronum thioautotrophicum TaxID=617001 RepID=UPI0005EB79D6|nr:redoxin family protein [Desulfonatronum thioautotrophicum]
MPRLPVIMSLVICWLALTLLAVSTSAGGPPSVGERQPEILAFAFPAPTISEHRSYLGIGEDQERIALQELEKDYFLLEIVGAYCPVCHNQAPDMLRLFQRIRRDAALSDKVGMFAVAAGATAMEVEHLHRTWRFPFPILQDADYDLHKIIGEPDTPFTMVVGKDGSILYAHLGRIDPEHLFAQLKQLP